MTEDESRAWIIARFGHEATARIAALLEMVVAENSRQNLIAPSTIPQIWNRHALDSAQLVPIGREGTWLDIGSGAGFPGLVVALLRSGPMILAEPRRKRAEFLQSCVAALGLADVEVKAAKVETLATRADVISARAVAPVQNLLQAAARCAKEDTRWLLPRGRSARADLQDAKRDWRGVFHVEQSLTDSESAILVADRVSRR